MANPHDELHALLDRQGGHGVTWGEAVRACVTDARSLAAAWDVLAHSGQLVYTGRHRMVGLHAEGVYATGRADLDLGDPVEPPAQRFSEDQPRDDHGRWSGGGGSDSGSGDSDSAGTAADHVAMVESRVKDALASGQATDVQFAADAGKGAWDPARADVHQQIVNDLYGQAAGVPNDGRAVIAGGLGGAGKSTVLADYAGIDSSQYLTLNPDDVKESMAARGLIPKVEGLSPMESAALVHEESSHITNLLAKQAYADHKNVIWDITMASPSSTDRRIGEIRASGYKSLGAVFVDIPVETSVSRAMSRYQRGQDAYRAGKGFGGRYVPPSIIRKNASPVASSVNRATFDSLRGKFDSSALYDNSGSKPVLVSK